VFNFFHCFQMNSYQFSTKERLLALIAIALGLLAVFGPDVSHLAQAKLHAHGHQFADARAWGWLPNAQDVLSNLPFAFFGAWGLRLLAQRGANLPAPQRVAAGVFFAGLLCTFAGSSYYHWAPDVQGLMLDRVGMGVAFAGVLGLAVAERVSSRAAVATTFVTCVSALLAAAICAATGNVLPWACVQFGGMAVVLWVAFLRPEAQALGVRWLPLIAVYALAKLLEAGDEWVLHATGELVSGHSLKHVAASLAALPVLAVLKHPASRPHNAKQLTTGTSPA
jgi:hypothetical protein